MKVQEQLVIVEFVGVPRLIRQAILIVLQMMEMVLEVLQVKLLVYYQILLIM